MGFNDYREKPPCGGCKDRFEGCHAEGKCPNGYEEWKKRRAETLEKLKRYKEESANSWSYFESMNSNKRRTKGR